MALPYAFRAFNGATRYSLLKPVVNSSPPVPVQPSCSKATFNTHCSKRSSSCQTALSEEILYLLLFLATFSILYIIITTKICQARISTNRAPDTFFLSEKAAVPHPHSRFFLPYIQECLGILVARCAAGLGDVKSVFLKGSSFTIPCIKDPFADTKAFWCYLQKLIRINKFNCLLQTEYLRRSQL